ncbi:protein translocase subunit SecD [[Kitasatospora] papulosa]|uniref:Protein translocase subunit SecD n=1 Tax=Streptomyces pratensis (strain ATCC 33331 / IAF-45CD) TaxID=591167 RepID=A0A8D3WKI3_STRFA|nr:MULTISPECIES: protein translocase subunit SecD [Streptomyces]MYT54108.1 protein translocase subunit SecD [Streptomyces sp. SID7815]MCX4413517.1 protein translocase subunit SecD [[Kitasatospora] papulosa]MCY1650490.1 protein translocase subunit SecD [Streptomyces sp. SL203]MCY1682375.1 protein translocase subunit SecD [Streptomyces sp. SL294]MDX3184498.1 protein translocase subunit SecD [Streptomyces sp. ME02-7008A-1]
MAAPKKGRGSSGGQGRPGRALALILIAMVALTGGMFLSGHTTPRLGIDLAGGTSITLKAKSQPGKPEAINETNMNTAVSIIERRVNGLGVSEAEVQTQGASNIIVNIPKGTNSAQAREQVGTTAQLYFRPVLTVAGGAPTPEGSASPSATGSGKPSATPSAKASDPETASDPKATPSDGATTQGRAVTGALKKDATPTPSGASESDAPAATETPDAATAALQKKFTELDCTDKAARAAAGDGVKPEDPTVACSSEGDAKYLLGPAEVSGTDVDDAKAQFDQQRGIWLVSMEFTDKGSKKFQTITKKLSTQQSPANQFAISLDGEVVSAPQVNETLSGSAEISGSFTQQSAEDLANVLSYGALPLSFSEDTVTTVTAALGGEQLEAGLIAGAIGLALVVIYLVAYYRGLALIALLSLVASGILTYTIMALLGPAIGFALNLPAVCGAIVAIGITADSFIVYFERIRDEIREGRTLRPAVERAWPRARRTILVSDFVSFLAAAVLFLVTVGKVQGFAFTLGLTTLLDVVVVFLFTKPVMTLMARTKFFGGGHPWSGLDPKRLGAKPPLRRSRRVNARTDHPKEA